jgi:hypothetical protein
VNGIEEGMHTSHCFVALFVALVGCTTPRYGSRVEYLGKEYRSSADTNKLVQDIPDRDAEQVRVFLGALPDGIERTESGLVPASDSKQRILGKVTTTSIEGFNKEDARYCHISRTAALMICSVSPFTAFLGLLACPCIGGHESNSVEDIELRKSALIAALQRATKASGGNAVLIDELGSTVAIQRDSRVVRTQEMTNASGWAVLLSP